MPAPDPLRALTPDNRHRIYADLRERAPAHWSDTHLAWVLTRHADVSAILRDPDALPLDVMPGFERLRRRGGPDLPALAAFCRSLSLLTRPPRHADTRRLLSQTLGGTRGLDLRGMIEGKANALLDRGEAEGAIDLADGYARVIALFLIGAFFGVADEEIGWLGDRARDLMQVFDSALPSIRALREMDRSAGDILDFFRAKIAERRRRPADDGLSLMVALADRDAAGGDEDLAGYCAFFFMAAEETTLAAIGEAARLLLSSADLRADVVARPERVPAVARECVRLASPIQYVVRQLPRDAEVGGVTIAAGQPMFLMLGAANRDPAAFPDPDAVRLDRDGPEPVDFAAGPYRCIGRSLAMTEVEVAIDAIAKRPRLALSDDPAMHLRRRNVAPLVRLAAVFG